MERADNDMSGGRSAAAGTLSLSADRGSGCENACEPHMDGSLRWYALKTKQRAEVICMQELDQKGIENLCPMTREFRFRRRRQEMVPLFPGYVFVRFAFPDQYDAVRWARGVSGIVRFGESAPPAINDGVIRVFTERMDKDGVIDTSRDLAPGQKVRFLSEPLRGMVGTILRNQTAQGRVHVLMDLLYQATIEVDDFQVQTL